MLFSNEEVNVLLAILKTEESDIKDLISDSFDDSDELLKYLETLKNIIDKLEAQN